MMDEHKLRYSVVQATTFEPEYPASELNRHSPNTRGWQTARFCEYPQEVVLELETTAQLRQIQVLSHQYKIATRIELFVGVDGKDWTRLGYMSLDANERTQFKARELKSAFVACRGRFLKLVVHRCHINRENLYNQVGIVAVNVVGVGSPVEKQRVEAPPPRLAEHLGWLVAARERAVEIEDYDAAQRLKDLEAQVRAYGAQVAQLEAAKKKAVQIEDYDRAKIVKAEIAAVVRAADAVLERARDDEDEEPMDHSSFQIDDVPVPAKQLSPSAPEAPSEDIEESQEAAPELDGVPNTHELPTPEPLQASVFEPSEVAAIAQVLGEYRARCLFSKNWALRDAALVKTRLMLENGELREDFERDKLCAVAKLGIDDRIAQVYFTAVDLCADLARRHRNIKALEPPIVALVAKLADNQARVRDKAFDVVADLATSVGVSYISSLLVKTLDKKHLVHNKWRPIAMRLALLRRLVNDDANRQVNPEAILRFLQVHDCASHTSEAVRNETRDLVAAIGGKHYGTSLDPFIGKLRPKQQEEYHDALAKAGASSRDPPVVRSPPPDVVKHPSPLTEVPSNSSAAAPVVDPDDEETFRDLIMKQLEEKAFSIPEAFDTLKTHFDATHAAHSDAVRDAVLREWINEIHASGPIDLPDDLQHLDSRDKQLMQVAMWLFQ